MKIKKIILENLNNKEIILKNENSEIKNFLILIGSNGTGKTRFLNYIFDNYFNLNIIKCKFTEEEKRIINICFGDEKEAFITNLKERNWSFNELMPIPLVLSKYWSKEGQNLWNQKTINKNLPKLIYLSIDPILTTCSKKQLVTYFDEYVARIKININNFLSVKEYFWHWWRIIYKKFGEEASPKKIKKEIIDKVNKIFELINSELLLKNISVELDKEVASIEFEKNNQKINDINKLSSGERKILSLILFLYTFEINDSIILFDEPETSLHPYWQKKIIKILKEVGNNNQFFIATHSPHIISDINEDEILYFLEEKNGKINMGFRNDIGKIKGADTNRILKEIMGVSERNDEITKLLQELNNLLEKNIYTSELYEKNYKKLIKIVGEFDIDVIRLNLKKEKIINDKNI